MDRMLKERILKKGDKVLIQTSGANLIDSFPVEQAICKDIYNIDLPLDITVATYQARTLTKNVDWSYVINDECDFPGEVYAEDQDLYTGRTLWMSGTVSDDQVFIYKGKEITKRNWVESKLPLAFQYSIDQGQKEKILAPLETHLLYHELTDMRYAKLWKNQRWELTEKQYWDKCIEMSNKYAFVNKEEWVPKLTVEAKSKNPNRQRDKNVLRYMQTLPFEEAYVKGKLESKILEFNRMRQLYGLKATELIHKAPSKVGGLNKLCMSLPGRSIVWAPYLNYLDKIIGKKYTYRPQEKSDVLKKYNNLELQRIGTSKGILRGTTPTLTDNLIMSSPIKSNTTFEQLIGRVIRTDTRKDKVAKLFICVTKDTYAERWVKMSCRKKGSYLDLNIVNTSYL